MQQAPDGSGDFASWSCLALLCGAFACIDGWWKGEYASFAASNGWDIYDRLGLVVFSAADRCSFDHHRNAVFYAVQKESIESKKSNLFARRFRYYPVVFPVQGHLVGQRISEFQMISIKNKGDTLTIWGVPDLFFI